MSRVVDIVRIVAGLILIVLGALYAVAAATRDWIRS